MDLSSTTDILIFIGAIASLIIIHEFGHFIVAKLSNVEVEEFGLGLPPRAATLFTWRGTIFSLNWLPLGGFVRPKGENNPDVEGGLAAASPWVRIAVLIAGPLANLLTAAVLFAVIFIRVGQPIPDQVMVMDVAAESPAARAGMETGDLIVFINDRVIDSSLDLREGVAENLGQETTFVVQRDNQQVPLVLTPRENPPEGQGSIGIMFGNPTQPVPITQALSLGANEVIQQSRFILTIPSRIAEGVIAPEEARLVGYKGMYDMFQSVQEVDAEVGAPTGTGMLSFFALLSISLGLLNLLPIPALDGGRILFVLPEILIRRRVPVEFENIVNTVSISLLILLMIYINVQDFVNPAQIP